jgi:prephenate dehydrogenase
VLEVSIVGLGLMGGSLALALKKAQGAGVRVTGFARQPETLARASDLGIIDSASADLRSAAGGAHLIVIATPVLATKDILEGIAPTVEQGCVVTDLGSTKALVMQWAEEILPRGVSFVGGHPMAGKETSGVEEADADLLGGCVYCLTPGKSATSEAVTCLEDLVKGVGAKPLIMDAERHDALAAGVSHLPMLLSAAFVEATMGSETWPRMAPLAAGGYRDVSRLASGSPAMNRDICVSNRDEIVGWIERYIDALERFRSMVQEGGDEVGEALSHAKEARQRWLEGRDS